MIKKIDIFLVLLLLLLSIGAVSATDDVNSTVMSSDEAISDIDVSDADEFLSADATDDELLTSNTFTVDSSNYASYFNSKGNLISTSVKEGDTLELNGTFNGKNFTFNKQINVVGTSTNHIKNGVVTLTEGASGSTVLNLKFTNTRDFYYGVFLNGACNCTVQGCIINNTGQSSYGICVANDAMYNNVTDNTITTYGKTYGHLTRSTPPMLLCDAHYNYIANNYIECDDANGIYLSSYQGGPLNGGVSTFNTIHNNTVKYNVLPTSWAYGIQIMGGNNTISSNTVIGAYRGISTSEHGNIIVDNWLVNLTGADYNNPGVPSGAEVAIVGSHDAIVRNNHIVNSRIMSSGAGISVLDNSVVENNYVEILLSGVGIHPQGSNIKIINNTIITNTGSGILYDTFSYNLTVLNNTISSNSGIGVLIKKLSDSKMPGNLTIVGNNISTSNKYAIDAAEANANSTNVIGPNIIKKGCEVKTPEGIYDPSKPSYVFNGTVHNINPSNIDSFIDANGKLSSNIKKGDILNFTGEFYNRIIYINSAIKITGDNPVFYNTTFRLSEGSWIEKVTIRNSKAERLNAWGVVAYKIHGATITNCDIYVEDPNAAYAVYVVEASDVDVINNTLSSSGDSLTYTLLGYQVEDCKFINNTINTLGTGVVHVFESQHCLDGDTNCLDGDTNCLDGDTNCLDGDTNCLDGDTNCLDGDTNCLDGDTNCLDGDTNCLDGDTNCLDGSSIGSGNHMLSEVYRTYGILMAYSSGNNVSGNKVNVTSKLNETVSTHNSTNSIVGIDLYFNSHNNNFADNEVYINANDNYIYGMGVLGYTTGHDAPEGQGATNNKFVNNYIVINGTYCVEGIIIGHESKDTIIKDNIIKLNSDKVAYGITLEMSQKSDISNNYMEVNSDVIYGIEAFSSNNNTMNNNELILNAKQVYGILFSNSNNNSVISNKIAARGTGENITFSNYDSIAAGNTGIFLRSISKGNEIRNNNITSQTGYAILVDDGAINNSITDNYLDSEKGIGNAAVNNTQNNVVEDNYRYTFGGKFSSPINVNYLETARITVTQIGDGALVKFYLTDKNNKVEYYIGSTMSSNGVANFYYKLNESLTPGMHRIKAVVSKENYKTKEFSNVIFTVKKGNLKVTLDNVSAKVLNDATFVATVSDVNGDPVPGVKVKFYRAGTYIGEATTGSNGIAKLVTNIPSVSGNEFNITAKVDDSSNFNSANGNAILTINNKDNINVALDDVFTNPNTNITLTATVKDASANALSGVNVKFYICKGDENVYIGAVATGNNGVAKLKYNVPSMFDGSCFISAKVDGTANYNSAIDRAILKTNKNSLNVILNDVSTYVFSETTFAATVKDIPGHLISGVNVNFYILMDGENVYMGNATTDNGGVAELNYDVSGIPYGEYIISVNVAENDKYYSSNNQSSLNIERYNLNIVVNDVTAVHNMAGNIVATLKDAKDNAISGVKVKIVLNKVTKYITTDSKGQVALSLNNLEIGNYTATFTSIADEFYNKATATANVIITPKIDTVLTAPDISVCYGDSGYLVATLEDVDGNAIGGAKLKIVLNKVTKYITTDANGQVSLKVANLDIGSYVATITFVATDMYNKASTTANVYVTKMDTTLTAPDISVCYGDSGYLVATLEDVDGNAIGGAKLKIVLNKVTKYITTDANGQVSLKVANLDIGSYVATITFVATDMYNKASTTANVYVTKMDTTLTAPDIIASYKDGSKLVATLKDVHGEAIGGAKLKIVLNKVTKYITTDANGQVALSLNNLDVGNYTATITFVGDDLYNKATTIAKITVTNKIATILTASDVIASYKDGSKLIATLKDANGNAISGVKIKIVINKVSKYITTDANGQVALSLANLDIGNYDAVITFVGDDLYNKATTTAKISILNKTNTILTAPDVTASYKDGSKLVATLKDVDGNAIGGAKLKIVLNKVTKYITTDANGQVALSLNNLDVGNYTAAITFVATELYNKSSITAKVNIN